MKFHLTNKLDNLKGNWWIWECDRENPDGSMTHGTVQADGQREGVAEETFEKDE